MHPALGADLLHAWVVKSTAETVYFSNSRLAWWIHYNRLVDPGFDEAALMTMLKAIAWRDLHEYFCTWSSVYRQFRRWTLSGL